MLHVQVTDQDQTRKPQVSASNRDSSNDERPAKRRRGESTTTGDHSAGHDALGLQVDGAADDESFAQTESAALREDVTRAILAAADPIDSGDADLDLSTPYGTSNTPSGNFPQFEDMVATANAALVSSRGTPTAKGGPSIRIESLPILDNLVIILPKGPM